MDLGVRTYVGTRTHCVQAIGMPKPDPDLDIVRLPDVEIYAVNLAKVRVCVD